MKVDVVLYVVLSNIGVHDSEVELLADCVGIDVCWD